MQVAKLTNDAPTMPKRATTEEKEKDALAQHKRRERKKEDRNQQLQQEAARREKLREKKREYQRKLRARKRQTLAAGAMTADNEHPPIPVTSPYGEQRLGMPLTTPRRGALVARATTSELSLLNDSAQRQHDTGLHSLSVFSEHLQRNNEAIREFFSQSNDAMTDQIDKVRADENIRETTIRNSLLGPGIQQEDEGAGSFL
jgi:hypothetical protein